MDDYTLRPMRDLPDHRVLVLRGRGKVPHSWVIGYRGPDGKPTAYGSEYTITDGAGWIPLPKIKPRA